MLWYGEDIFSDVIPNGFCQVLPEWIAGVSSFSAGGACGAPLSVFSRAAMASMSSSVMGRQAVQLLLDAVQHFFPVGHGFPVVTVQEKGGDRAGERPHEADSGNHQKNREKLARRGDRVGVSVAHGGWP